MAEPLSAPHSRGLRRSAHPAWLLLALAVPAAVLTALNLANVLPASRWLAALVSPNADRVPELVFHFSALPRIAVALLGGAALALSGTIFQQILRNPLAEPTTLGTSAGAALALTCATLWAPSLLAHGREPIAIAGAALATGLALALAWNKVFAPLTLILAGLVITLYASTLGATLTLFHGQSLSDLFIWASGSLNQDNWDVARFLAVRVAIAAALAALLTRPLGAMSLADDNARNLGLSPRRMRMLALVIAVGLGAVVVAAVGIVSFVGLLAPALARLTGARRLRDQLLWAPLTGATLLWLADQVAQAPVAFLPPVPTGVVTAVLGAPVLYLLLKRLHGDGASFHEDRAAGPHRHRPGPWLSVVTLVVLAAALWAALTVGRGSHGWFYAHGDALANLLPWRAPRALAALAAGVMLATAGVLVQRLTANPMASPEVLGVSSGAALGLVIAVLFAPGGGRAMQLVAAAAGAGAALAATLLPGRRAGFTPMRTLLAGVIIGTLCNALVTLATAGGSPYTRMILDWLAGSTYNVGPAETLVAVVAAVVLVALSLLCTRWLDLLPLGSTVAQAFGLSPGRTRLALLVLSAAMSAFSTLLVGPLTFVGLMAPHIATMLGYRRALGHMAGSALIGSLIMVCADWAGRNVLFPFQIPAGLIATLIGGPYFMWLMRRTR
ncbi:iron complex transport system permease protein [Paraburkholderia caballeronis]|uniref:Fe(3+)-hydroxamate ABC transporter permease FhuB n=1 Tax=Paraburkholderia caballeronis TaxID=416943 RepID=UPI0010659567|nr:Fe(3+)-hydroxamate ABC transporter permease FhuB [Paraburkholderia caballeronis]TDV35516.1 iron complex transport system permease protein [Paraburkholderia caballeronis]